MKEPEENTDRICSIIVLTIIAMIYVAVFILC